MGVHSPDARTLQQLQLMARCHKGPFRGLVRSRFMTPEEQEGLRSADIRNANLKCSYLFHTTDPRAPNSWSSVTRDTTEAPLIPTHLLSINLTSDREGKRNKLWTGCGHNGIRASAPYKPSHRLKLTPR